MYDTWRITVSYRASNTAGPASVRKGFSSSSSRLKMKSKKGKRALIISRPAFLGLLENYLAGEHHIIYTFRSILPNAHVFLLFAQETMSEIALLIGKSLFMVKPISKLINLN